jgi:hypothetical protein
MRKGFNGLAMLAQNVKKTANMLAQSSLHLKR